MQPRGRSAASSAAAPPASITSCRGRLRPRAPPCRSYSARVELSSKVLDSLAKLERTLCHELCHVAAWLVDHTAKPPHGPVFRRWAEVAMARYPHLDITTCHAYDIFYPFRCGGVPAAGLLLPRRIAGL